MMDWTKHILRYIIAMLLQILIVGNLQLFGICQPYVYIVFLLMMPTRFPRWADMIIGALIGLIMDTYCNSLGVHMSACIMLCYFRRPIIQNLVLDYDRLTGEISGNTIGTENYIRYATLLIAVHHAVVFIVSAWSFAHIWMTLLTTLVSSIVSIILILGYDYIRDKRR